MRKIDLNDVPPGKISAAGIPRDVLSREEICEMVPFLKKHPRLFNFLYKTLAMDKVNWIHGRNSDEPGVPFTDGMIRDLEAKVEIRGEEELSRFAEGGFITVSNHPFGAMDGVLLINTVGHHRADFKVMVNMFLMHIHAAAPNFIGVDALASNDPAKKAASMRGIAASIKHVKEGHVLGFFPAGAVSKLTWKFRIEDREWQPNVMRIIKRLNVPVVPIYFHGHNSWWFTFLGMIDWRLRTLRLPAEVFHRDKPHFRISVGKAIMPEEQARYETPEELAAFLKSKTYAMKKW